MGLNPNHSAENPTAAPAEREFAPLEGGCHCRRVRYRLATRVRRVLDCNCSICTKKGFLHLIVPQGDFQLLSGAEALTTYRFNTRVAAHHFCASCGVHCHYVPRSHPDQISVNVRTLDAPAPPEFVVEPFDGQRWEESVEEIR